MDKPDRHRRHDEAWQAEVLDGLARLLDVLHDISDSTRQFLEATQQTAAQAIPPAPAERATLVSIDELAERLGVSRASLYGMRSAGRGPVATKVGRRLMYQPDDVSAWLQEQREHREPDTRPWGQAFLPGRIGSGVPRSSEPVKRSFCEGSHSEPMAASKYSGRAVCRVCRDDVIVNRDGRLRKHYPRWW